MFSVCQETSVKLVNRVGLWLTSRTCLQNQETRPHLSSVIPLDKKNRIKSKNVILGKIVNKRVERKQMCHVIYDAIPYDVTPYDAIPYDVTPYDVIDLSIKLV